MNPISNVLITPESEDKFEAEYVDIRLNCNDVDSQLFQRTPDDNDRPELEKYYNRLPKDDNKNTISVPFYGFVVAGDKRDENRKRSAVINIVNDFGELMAMHVNELEGTFKEYRGEFISFDAKIYKYKSKNKYGLFIIKDSIQIVNTRIISIPHSNWNWLGYPVQRIRVQEVINYYLTQGDSYHDLMLRNSEKILDRLSELMFGVSGLLYNSILNMYLMRDDITKIDKFLWIKSHKHLNILMTTCIDYIIWLKPVNYLETLKIITYIVLNYIGGYVDDPRNRDYDTCIQNTIKTLDIKVEHVKYHIENMVKNCGGLQAISEVIPDSFKLNPMTVVEVGRQCFAQRVLKDVPEESIKYLVNLNGCID